MSLLDWVQKGQTQYKKNPALNWRSQPSAVILPKPEKAFSPQQRAEIYSQVEGGGKYLSPNSWVAHANNPEITSEAFRIIEKFSLYENFGPQQWYNLIVYSPNFKKAIKLAEKGGGFKKLNKFHWAFLIKNNRTIFVKYYKKYYLCHQVDKEDVLADALC